MARSTFAMTLVMLMLPATALRNKDDAVTMQSGISEARDPEAELSSWLMEVGLSYEDAGWWAQKESWYLKTCGATLPYLKKLYQELTGGLALPKGDAIPKMFDYAKKALDPAQLSNMFWVLHDCNVEKGLCLYKEEALSRAPGLLEMGTSSTELLKLYNFLTDDIERPKKEAMEVAAAGCEADKYWSAYQATHHKLAALDEAVRTSFEMQAFRYAVDGRPYTVAEDGKAYSVPQFWEYFKDDWLSKWHEAKWATQRRIAEDGTVYTLEEFAEHYKSQWQQKWADAPVALCKGSFGECFWVSHRVSKVRRVCKRIPKEETTLPEEEVQTELEILKKLDHPNVLRVFEWFEEEFSFLLVVEEHFEDGEAKPHPGIDENLARELVEQALQGLAYVHSMSVIHRDIKPANMLLASADLQKPRLLLADFGVAEIFQECASAVVKGTVAYMAPEVFSNETTAVSDVWAMGVVIYELLASVLFEPFVSVYYLGPEREHPRHTDLPADPQYTYKKMWDQLLNPPGGESVSFAKDFAVTLPRRWWRSKEMAEVKHSFLIRHPEPAMTSMLRACKDPESTGYSYFNETEMGYSELVAMFEYVTKELHQVPPVIDHDDLMKQPEAVLRSFLGHLGLDFDERMLHWTEPLPPHPEIWAGFFENANRSTGFKPTRVERKSTEAPAEIADAIARAMPAYSLLASHRLQMYAQLKLTQLNLDPVRRAEASDAAVNLYEGPAGKGPTFHPSNLAPVSSGDVSTPRASKVWTVCSLVHR
ncbi:hypothetical protein AK812_SmicGene14385 [Symbiodinium microadriaticum]|uniref:Protein kinase domain-containing protein n=1 Tax=Symbiodinium microadriaticum TaxID=2951 RepID=A0A1Q9E5M5_SYMMI|nr:hypothetical protein AK812_SmicGene14385 [Symbiodinium microadriaticum]